MDYNITVSSGGTEAIYISVSLCVWVCAPSRSIIREYVQGPTVGTFHKVFGSGNRFKAPAVLCENRWGFFRS